MMNQRFFLILFCSLLVFSCHNKPKHTFVIGVSQCSDDAWRRTMNNEMLREASFYPHIRLVIKTAYDNNDRQIHDIQDFIDAKVDAIIVSPNEAEPITPIVEKAFKAGIPVIMVDRKIVSDQYTAFVGADNFLIGKEVGNYAVSLLQGKGNIVEIQGLKGSTPASERHRGFLSAISKYPNMHIIYSNDGKWLRSPARQEMQIALKQHSGINLVFAQNDEMAIGANQAAIDLKRNQGIKFIGIDALSDAGGGIEQVLNGALTATFIYPTGGEKTIQTTIAILSHKPFNRENVLYTAAVDKTNARIIKLQTDQINDHQKKIAQLNGLLSENLAQYSTQRTLLYGALLFLLLTIGFLFFSAMAYRSKSRLNKKLEQKNIAIEQQKETLSVQHEQLLALSKNLQEATQAKLVFFTNISHEFRTPLTLLTGPIDTLLSTSTLKSNEQRLLLLMRKNANILLNLISQLIDFRKYENGKLPVNFTLSDLKIFLKDESVSFKELAKRKHIHFHVKTSDDRFTIWIDMEKLEKIYFNLLSNAFKNTLENGHIDVTLTKEIMNDEEYAMLSVSDDGKGIPKEALENIFDRFYKVDPYAPGSGIGLAFTKALVELHHGKIEIESEEGHGTTFTVYLPVQQKEIPIANAITENTATHGTLSQLLDIDDDVDNEEDLPKEAYQTTEKPMILLVEDNADVLTYIKTILQADYTILEASNGKSGLIKAMKYVPELIVSDVMMDGMNGFELCRQVKETLSTSHIPVMLLTACSLDEEKATGFESGADAYIQKPFNERLFTIRVRKLIENRKKLKELFRENQTFGEIKASVSDIDKDFITQFHKFIEENIANSELNVDDMGKELGLSRVQLYRKLKSLTNYAPNELVRIIRLRTAANLLETTDQNVSEIAYAAGFTSPSYFTKCFRDYFNESPSDYGKNSSPKTENES
jgi:signal transduction histidine kinase/DNA-binding response OmpR family regulator